MDKNKISSNRILLRNFENTDVDAIFAYRSLEEIAKFQYWKPYTKDETIKFVERCIDSTIYTIGEWIGLAIINKENQKLIGDCAMKINQNNVEIGCNISPRYQQLGFAKEALRLLINHCFENKNIEEIFGITDSANTASIRLMESMQMVKSLDFEEKIICKGSTSVEHKYILKRPI